MDYYYAYNYNEFYNVAYNYYENLNVAYNQNETCNVAYNQIESCNVAYNQNEICNVEAKRSASEAGFIDEGGSSVPLPEELTKMFKPLECELCGVIVTSEVTAYTHYEGKVHMKNVNAYMKEQYNIFGSMKKAKVEFTPHQCEVCKCDLSSLIQAQQHYGGKVHKKNLRKINYDPSTTVIPQPVTENDDLGPDLLKDLPPPPPPPVLSDFICEICNITTNTEYQLIVHKNGTKHKKKVKKLKESFGDCGTDGFGYYLGEVLTDVTTDQSEYSTTEPLVTEYLPLSDEPLHFNNSFNNNSAQNDATSEKNYDNDDGQSGALCIKWFNDKTEAMPTRPMENAWVETFSKNNENGSLSSFPAQINNFLNKPMEQTHNTNQINFINQPPSDTADSDQISNSFMTTNLVPQEIANLPQFSVAAVLPQLQEPPCPPVTLMSNNLFEGAISGTASIDPASKPPSIEIPKINFRNPQPIVINESCATSLTTECVLSTTEEQDNKSDNINLNKADNIIQHKKDDQNSLLQSNSVISTRKNSSKTETNILTQATSKQNSANPQSSNIEDYPKLANLSQTQTADKAKGRFITTNWEASQETNIENDNSQKKKKGVNFLFGFKKELDKKKSADVKNLVEDSIHTVLATSDRGQQNNQTGTICDKALENKETDNAKDTIIKETIVPIKEANGGKEIKDKIILKKDIINVKEKLIKDKICTDKETNSTKEYLKKDKNDLSRASNSLKEKSSSREDIERKRHSDKKTEVSKHSKDKSLKKHRKDRYERSPHDHHRSKDHGHKKYKKHKDDYDRYKDSDDEYWEEKKKHKHKSRDEKHSDRNYNAKKPTIAQPFVHKSSSKPSVLSYLAPPSDIDSKDIAMYRAPSGLYYCTHCDYKSKHSSEFTNHLYSRSHKEKRNKNTK